MSDISDYINVTVSERLIKTMDLSVGASVEVDGQFRSYNNYSSTGNRLLFDGFFARDIAPCDGDDFKNPNYIYLNGFICKAPVYRITPFGREITDILLAVNRAYNKSDYMPCIAWGRNARFSGSLAVGDNIKKFGDAYKAENIRRKCPRRKQSPKTAFEISISKMEVIPKDENERQ
ncbi:MAG: single-stranded DNA-binding protein [Clostridiales bacterium]|nr:MAG: single-stranded DNA-binding protein [Clostridiales bacterium]